MFETQIALEKAQGYRGPATRLFAPITTREEAVLVHRECCILLLALAGLYMFFAFRFSAANLLVAFGLGLPALLLLLFRRRFAAALLMSAAALLSLLLLLLGASHPGPILGRVASILLIFGLSARASRATFFYARFTAPPPATPPSGLAGT